MAAWACVLAALLAAGAAVGEPSLPMLPDCVRDFATANSTLTSSCSLAPGNYHLRRLEVKPGVEVEVHGPARIEASEALIVGGGLRISGMLALTLPSLLVLDTAFVVAPDCDSAEGGLSHEPTREQQPGGVVPEASSGSAKNAGATFQRGDGQRNIRLSSASLVRDAHAFGKRHSLTFGCALNAKAAGAPFARSNARRLLTKFDDEVVLDGVDEGIAVAHAVVVAIGVAAALIQALTDCGRAACRLPPLHSGPTSAVAKSLPFILPAGVGVLDLVEHGQFTLLLSQLHAQAPAVIHRAGTLMLPTTGLVPGAWPLLEPLLRPGVAPLNVSDVVNPLTDPHSIQAFAKPLGVPSTWLLTFALTTFVIVQLVIAVAFGALLADATLRKPGVWDRRRSPAAGAVEGGSAPSPEGDRSLVAIATAGSAAESATPPASERLHFDAELALAHGMIISMVTVGMVFFRALAMLAFNDMRLSLELTNSEWRRVGGWVSFVTMTWGLRL